MQPFSFLLSVRRGFSFRVRLAIALLALIQIVAPTWHVCILGENLCCPPTSSQAEHQHDPLSTEAEVLSGAKVLCELHPEPAHPNAETVVGSLPETHGDNCLAKLLLGMPWQSILPAEVPAPFPARISTSSSEYFPLSLAALPQPPARAPPLPSSFITVA